MLTGDNARGGRGVAGIYTKTVKPPPCPAGHTPFFTVDQGIHRHALFRANGRLLGEHTGYLTPFEADLTGCSPSCTLEVTLDGGRPCVQRASCASTSANVPTKPQSRSHVYLSQWRSCSSTSANVP
mgnify:CR=1 FL=1